MNKKESGIAHLLVIIFLLAGLAAAVYLVQQKTNFLPKADTLVSGNTIQVPILQIAYFPTTECRTTIGSTKLNLPGITASSPDYYEPPYKAFDGNIFQTKWQPKSIQPGIFLKTDLGSNQTVNAISLYFYYIDKPQSYHIDASTTGQFSGEETRIVTETDSMVGFVEIQAGNAIKRKDYFFSPVNARYFKLTVDKYRNDNPSADGQINLYEWEFYNENSPAKQCLNTAITGPEINVKSDASMSDPLSEIRARINNHMQGLINAVKEGSKYHGYKNSNAVSALNPYILQSFEYTEPIPASTIFYPRPDYKAILNRINICDYVDNRGVKEVWLWGYHNEQISPKIVPDESNMSMGLLSKNYWNMPQVLPDAKFKSSPYAQWGDISNGSMVNDLPQCQHTYTLYNPTYIPSYDNAVHNYLHQIENVLAYSAGSDSCDYGATVPASERGLTGTTCKSSTHTPNMFWDLYVGGQFYKATDDRRCGHSHTPPNSQNDYSYNDQTYVTDSCEDWKPDASGIKQTFNCTKWNCQTLKYYIWWMQNIPGLNNGLTFNNDILKNWWDFMGNFDEAIKFGKSLTMPKPATPTPTPSFSPTPTPTLTPSPTPTSIPTPTPTPYLQITNPTSSTVWNIGQSVRITWNYWGNNTLDIYVRQAGGSRQIARILTGGKNVGYYDWVVSGFLPATDFMVSLRGSSGSSADSQYFTIADNRVPSIKITKPAAGEIVKKGLYKITWDSVNNPKVDLYYRSVQNPAKIGRFATSLPNVGYYNWNNLSVPLNGTSEQFQILIRGSSGSSDDSQPFTLTN